MECMTKSVPWASVKRLETWESHLETQGRRLSQEEARQILQHTFPDAELKILEYEVRTL